MKTRITFTILAGLLLVQAASVSGQDKTYRVGDTIFVNAFFGGCVRATVKGIEPAYYVHIEEGTYKGSDTFYNANRVKDCPQTPVAAAPGVPGQANAMAAGRYKVGDTVDVGENRGSIVASTASLFRVHFPGCDAKFDVEQAGSSLRPAAAVSINDPEIKYLIGKWKMTTVGISSVAIAWGKSPGLQIESDGTFTWFQDRGTPVKGRWTADARVEGARTGDFVKHGIVVTDALGRQWKITREKSLIDQQDRAILRLMCKGQTQNATRAR